MTSFQSIIVATLFGLSAGLAIGSYLHRRSQRKGSVILEYSFSWIPTDATIPLHVSHAQELNLSKSNEIVLDHKPSSAVRVTVRDTQYNEIVQFYIG